MGVAVALDDLGGDDVGLQAHEFAGPGFHGGSDDGVVAHSAGKLAGAHVFHGGGKALLIAQELGIETGELEAVGDGFAVDAVGTAHAHKALVLAHELRQRVEHHVEVLEDELACLHHLQGHAGIHHVGRRTAEVDEAGRGADLLFKVGEEGDDVVAGGLFDLEDAVDIEVHVHHDVLQVFIRDDALLVPGLAHGLFHLEPVAVAVFQSPDSGHLGPGIAVDHVSLYALAPLPVLAAGADSALGVEEEPSSAGLEPGEGTPLVLSKTLLVPCP